MLRSAYFYRAFSAPRPRFTIPPSPLLRTHQSDARGIVVPIRLNVYLVYIFDFCFLPFVNFGWPLEHCFSVLFSFPYVPSRASMFGVCKFVLFFIAIIWWLFKLKHIHKFCVHFQPKKKSSWKQNDCFLFIYSFNSLFSSFRPFFFGLLDCCVYINKFLSSQFVILTTKTKSLGWT